MTRRRMALIGGSAFAIAAGGATLGLVLSAAATQAPAYRTLPGTCRLLTSSVLTRYLPDPITDPQRPAGSRVATTGCEWTSVSDEQERVLDAEVQIYSGPAWSANAQSGLRQLAAEDSKGWALAKTRPVYGIGDQATAIYLIASSGKSDPPTTQFVMLDVRSSNAIVSVMYSDMSVTGSSSRASQHPAGLGDQVTLARDILTVLAHRATAAATVTAQPSGPDYGAPAHACQLVPPATLRRYLPGATADPIGPDTPTAGMSDCQWDNSSSSWYATMNIDVYSSSLSTGMLGPQAGYEVAVQQADAGSGDSTGLGTQPVAWAGGHATAIYTTSSQRAFQGVTLVAWSGDAVIQVSYQVDTSTLGGQTPPPRSTELTIVTGIAHAAFAALPHGATLLMEKHPSR